MVSSAVLTERGRNQIPSGYESIELESGLEHGVSAEGAANPATLFFTQGRRARSGPRSHDAATLTRQQRLSEVPLAPGPSGPRTAVRRGRARDRDVQRLPGEERPRESGPANA